MQTGGGTKLDLHSDFKPHSVTFEATIGLPPEGEISRFTGARLNDSEGRREAQVFYFNQTVASSPSSFQFGRASTRLPPHLSQPRCDSKR
jgi:hypothetical protein